MRCLWSTVSLCRSLTEESVVVAASRTRPLCSATTASRHSSNWDQLGCSLQVQLDTSCWQLRPPAAEAGEEQVGAAVLLSELMLVSSQLPLELPASHSGHSAVHISTVRLASPGGLPISSPSMAISFQSCDNPSRVNILPASVLDQ